MQKQNKTNKNRTAPMKAATPATTRKSRTAKAKTKQPACTSAWLSRNTNRPKTVIVEMQRTATGYSIKEAVVLSPINQHASRHVPVSAKALTEDINRRGITI